MKKLLEKLLRYLQRKVNEAEEKPRFSQIECEKIMKDLYDEIRR